MNRFFAVALALIVAILASLSQVEAKQRDSAKAVQKDSLYWAGRCTLEVINDSPATAKLRIGHWWWERQMGTEPHYEAKVPIAWDKEHVMNREFWLNGRKLKDKYKFFVPYGTKKYTIIIDGTYAGALVNRSGVPVIVMPPSAARAYRIPNFGQKFGIKEQPGRRDFVVYFGPDYQRYRVIPFIIKNIREGRFIQARTEVDGEPYIVSRWVDWVGHIEPYDNVMAVPVPPGAPPVSVAPSISDDEDK